MFGSNLNSSSCKECRKNYDSKIIPMRLECKHTFCNLCIEKTKQSETSGSLFVFGSTNSERKSYICPDCKIKSNVIEIDDSEILKSTENMINEQKQKICESHTIETQNYYCINKECMKFLCSNCIFEHIDKSHSVSKLSQDFINFYIETKFIYKANIKDNLFNTLKTLNKNLINDLFKRKDEIINEEKSQIQKIYEENLRILSESKKTAELALEKVNQDLNYFINSYMYVDISVKSLFESCIHPVYTTFNDEIIIASKQIDSFKYFLDKNENEKIRNFNQIFINKDINLNQRITDHIKGVFKIVKDDFMNIEVDISKSYQSNALKILVNNYVYNDNFAYSDYNNAISFYFEEMTIAIKNLFGLY